MDLKEYLGAKRTVSIPRGEVSYADIGEGPVALFIHGVFMNGFLWRNVIEAIASDHRCIAIDLPAHGGTSVELDFGFSLKEHADLVAAVLDALGIARVDLIGNDTGGAISQVFAVRHPAMVRTLALTNCDVSENFPPEEFKWAIELAQKGELAALVTEVATDLELARSEDGLGVGYEHKERITQEIVSAFLGRYKDPAAAREIERRIASVAESGGLTEIEEEIKALNVPTLVVWGTGDKFFDVSWAYWLRDNVAGVTEVVEIEGGKLFFVDERADELVPHLTRHWAAHADATRAGTRAGAST
jgi:pimeloyl-ACP methyl ester carboxylesterase